MITEVKTYICKCNKCGWIWNCRKLEQLAKVCPKKGCKALWWNRERQ